jgi:F0F1-type ATP synthase assembly protein I
MAGESLDKRGGSKPDPLNPSGSKAGGSGPAKDSDKNGMATVGRYLTVGIALPVSSMVGYGIGFELDQHLGTHWLAITLMLVGTVGGFIQLIREITR